MKFRPLLLLSVLLGTMSLSSAPEVHSKNELFPIFGIILGVTSKCELDKMGEKLKIAITTSFVVKSFG